MKAGLIVINTRQYWTKLSSVTVATLREGYGVAGSKSGCYAYQYHISFVFVTQFCISAYLWRIIFETTVCYVERTRILSWYIIVVVVTTNKLRIRITYFESFRNRIWCRYVNDTDTLNAPDVSADSCCDIHIRDAMLILRIIYTQLWIRIHILVVCSVFGTGYLFRYTHDTDTDTDTDTSNL